MDVRQLPRLGFVFFNNINTRLNILRNLSIFIFRVTVIMIFSGHKRELWFYIHKFLDNFTVLAVCSDVIGFMAKMPSSIS